MTYASIRTIFGRTEAHEPSRFLYEFPDELKEELAFRRKREDSFIAFGVAVNCLWVASPGGWRCGWAYYGTAWGVWVLEFL